MRRNRSRRWSAAVAPLGVALAACSTSPDETREPVAESARTPSGLYYEVLGSGEPVVLLHGFSLDRRMWDREAQTLARTHRVLRYDQRGHGLSGPWEQPFSQHEDLLEILTAAGVERATLIGLSGGAEIAVDFTLAFPEHVDRLVLVSPGLSGYRPTGSFEWMGPVFEALQAGDPQEANRRWVETPLMKQADPEADAAMREIVLPNWKIWTYAPDLRRMLDPPAMGRLAEVHVPTLVVLGADDMPDIHAVGRLLTEGIAGARIVTIEGAGHLVNFAQPERFNAELESFLAGTGG